jgi:hypothetical protein
MQLQSFNTVNFTAPFDAGGDAPQNTYRLVGRVDFNPSDRTQMFFRAGRENQNQFKGSYFYSAYPQYDGGSTNLNQSYLYSLSHTFTSNLFGSAKFSFTRFNDGQTFNTSLVNTPNLVLTPPNDPATQNFIQFPGLANTGGGSGSVPSAGPQNTFQVEPNLAWNKGKHLMRFGASSPTFNSTSRTPLRAGRGATWLGIAGQSERFDKRRGNFGWEPVGLLRGRSEWAGEAALCCKSGLLDKRKH